MGLRVFSSIYIFKLSGVFDKQFEVLGCKLFQVWGKKLNFLLRIKSHWDQRNSVLPVQWYYWLKWLSYVSVKRTMQSFTAELNELSLISLLNKIFPSQFLIELCLFWTSAVKTTRPTANFLGFKWHQNWCSQTRK